MHSIGSEITVLNNVPGNHVALGEADDVEVGGVENGVVLYQLAILLRLLAHLRKNRNSLRTFPTYIKALSVYWRISLDPLADDLDEFGDLQVLVALVVEAVEKNHGVLIRGVIDA